MKYQVKIWFILRMVDNHTDSHICPITDDDKDFLECRLKEQFQWDDEINWLPIPTWAFSDKALIARVDFECPEEDSAEAICDAIGFGINEQFSDGFGEMGFDNGNSTIYVEAPESENMTFISVN